MASRRRPYRFTPYLFLTPNVAVFLVFIIAPAIYSDLGKLAEGLAQGRLPESLCPRVRRVRSKGLS